MELREFTEKIVSALEEFYGADARIETHHIYRNNGLKLQGICVLMSGRNIAPTVYLNHFFEAFLKGTDFGEILSQIITLYEENQISQNLDIDFFLDYRKVKKRLVLRLIHRERNKEMLKEVPHQVFHDLAVVCHCLLVNQNIGTGSILIHRHHLESWKIDEEELFRAAYENSPRIQPCQIHRMYDMVKEIMGRAVEDKVEEICQEYPQNKDDLVKRTMEDMEVEIQDFPVSMYVLTNAGRYYGAACLLYEGTLEKAAEKIGGDFYLLPSSVHEVILVAKQEKDKKTDFNKMVQEVNQSQVEPQEWLSDHAYLYKKEEKQLISLA
ncbi:MAG: DUF5688 family protein [Lachnospiraceae bacterium]|nr:DUF5688 family protein [Lachnospiraceae bacterium]MDD7027600.1 DUF5688 family protein [Lachnospiraceae bacterium]MDY5700784.1 DUF5688 family protein [Lachnospiraceae bacterium]